jgi:hypothetical protein
VLIVDVPYMPQAARDYFYSAFQRSLVSSVFRIPDLLTDTFQTVYDCMLWIRLSNGRLCADLVPPTNIIDLDVIWDEKRDRQGMLSLSVLDTKATTVIDSLTLKEYHSLCAFFLHQVRRISISTPLTVNLGAVVSCSSNNRLEDSVEIAFLSDRGTYGGRWETPGGVLGKVVKNGWTRYGDFACIMIYP